MTTSRFLDWLELLLIAGIAVVATQMLPYLG